MRALVIGLLISLFLWLMLILTGMALWNHFVVEPIVPHLDAGFYQSDNTTT